MFLAPFHDAIDPQKIYFYQMSMTNVSHTLSEAQNDPKRVSIAKLLVTNDYQHFLAHFELFLALFQISDVKPELSLIVCKIAFCQAFS